MTYGFSTGVLKRGVAMGALALLLIHLVGTVGFRVIGGEETSFFDAFYMTFITVATIGTLRRAILSMLSAMARAWPPSSAATPG